MRINEVFILNKGTKVIITITFSVSVLAILFAFFYYRGINRSEDPRVRQARELLAHYDEATGKINSMDFFPLLDSARAVYASVPDYRNSFETGLILNNKCSALLLMALYDSTLAEKEKTTLLNLAMAYCDSSIANYSEWIAGWENLPENEIESRIRPFMQKDDPAFQGYNFDRIVEQRIKYLVTAQVETPRRLSVSLTNKGTIYRHMRQQDSALIYYREALGLWPENRTAESNLSVLMGGNPVKPSFLKSLFPPDKNKK
jgi:tetratricopeptide (TPR) repeat protein